MRLGLLIGVACAVLFFRAAQYERMSPWAWVIASVGLTLILSLKVSSITLLLIAQVALFLLMWWYNVRRQDRRPH
jgi:4-amino-4-deoxy-L-arabinose transferase-like glycosyltransferase